MESCSDSDSNDDGLEIGRHGHGDEDIVINTEHASKEVDAEGDGEAEAVAGVDEGMNSRSGRSYSPSGSGFHHSASVRKDDERSQGDQVLTFNQIRDEKRRDQVLTVNQIRDKKRRELEKEEERRRRDQDRRKREEEERRRMESSWRQREEKPRRQQSSKLEDARRGTKRPLL